jgi:hypothetical protein
MLVWTFGEGEIPSMRPAITVPISSVRKICQLTGETDRQLNGPAFNQTESRFRLYGTDLGSSFEHAGLLWFLFGDTWREPRPSDDFDSIAWTSAKQPEPGIRLEFINDGRAYVSPKLKGEDGEDLSTTGFNVPIAGFSDGAQMYIFHTTDSFKEEGGEGGLDAFWIGPNGGIRSTWANPLVGGNWRPAFQITPGGSHAASAIAVITRLNGLVDVFSIEPDGGIGTTFSNAAVDGGRWQPLFRIAAAGAARADSPVTAVTRFQGAVDVFWIGRDGDLNTAWFNPDIEQGKWHTPFPITPREAARPHSPLAATTRLDGLLDVFWIGADGSVNTAFANPAIEGGRWQLPFPISGPRATRANSPMAALTRGAGGVDVFWIAPDGAVATTWFHPDIDGGKWHTPFPITSPNVTGANSGLAAITRLDGLLDVFWIGRDGSVGTAFANPAIEGGRWQQPFNIAPAGAARADSSITAITRFEGAVDVFWIGKDSDIYTAWFNPAVENGRWHFPFPITHRDEANLTGAVASITRRNGVPGMVMMGRTVLAKARNNNPTKLKSLYDFSVLREGGKFLNVACAVAPAGIAELPFEGPALLAWGSARYRESNVYLACAPLGAVQLKSAWWFYTGQIGSPTPAWSPDQRLATALFDDPQVGELSVGRVEGMGLWLMLYNSASPRGITARVATSPWGLWSNPTLIFDPGWPGLGYGHFMHGKKGSDNLSDQGREDEWGGEYGPYLIDRYTRIITGDGRGVSRAQVYFVLSTWNPYNTMLMTATIQRESDKE